MFSFALWKAEVKEVPPHKIVDLPSAILVANNFLRTYSKVQIILNDKAVIKEFTNPTLGV